MTAKVSRPSMTERITSACPGRSWSKPKVVRRDRCRPGIFRGEEDFFLRGMSRRVREETTWMSRVSPGVMQLTRSDCNHIRMCLQGDNYRHHDVLLCSGHPSARLGSPYSGGRVESVPAGHRRGESQWDPVCIRRGLRHRRVYRRAPEYQRLRFLCHPRRPRANDPGDGARWSDRSLSATDLRPALDLPSQPG